MTESEDTGTAEGQAPDPTEVIDAKTQGAALAWSQADTDDVTPYVKRRSYGWWAAAAGIVALVGAGAAAALMHKPNAPAAPPVAAPPPPPPRGPIDGTYRVDRFQGDGVVTMPNGKVTRPAPEFRSVLTEWWAFQSRCTPSGCGAIGTRLDSKTHATAAAQLVPDIPENEKTQSLRLINGHWVSDPPNHVPQDCVSGGGHDMWRFTVELTQLPDESLRGQESDLAESNECGVAGMTSTTPVVATRVGDVPASLPPLNAK